MAERTHMSEASARGGTISGKIVRLVWLAVLPIAVVAVYAIFSIGSFYRVYDQNIQNIAEINAFNVTFQANINNTMYYLVIGGYDPEDIQAEDDYRNPHYQISELRSVVEQLQGRTDNISASSDLEKIIRLLDSLEPRIDEMIEECGQDISLAQKLNLLSDNIRRLTDKIQMNISSYVALGVADMEAAQARISRAIRIYVAVLIGLVILLLLVVMLLSSRTSRQITEPIRSICATTQKIAEGNFAVRLPVNAGDETDMLAESFNQMAAELSDLVEDIRIEQNNAKDAELRLLQEQINPHFLYNTLDAIVWLIESGQTQSAEKMVSSLSAFFRTSLSKGRDWITVGEEKEHIRSYLEIQQIRYADILQYRIDIPKEIADYYLMKLMLQPLIENALYHGIKNKRGGGLITVTGEERGSDLIFTVEDNGIGMTWEELIRLRRLISGHDNSDSTHGFGIGNVAQRIRLYCGEDYGITAYSEYGKGSRISVRIPKLMRPIGMTSPDAFLPEEQSAEEHE